MIELISLIRLTVRHFDGNRMHTLSVSF